MLISSYISAGGFVLYDIGAVVDAQNRNARSFNQANLVFAGIIITQIFSVSYIRGMLNKLSV